MSKNVKQVDAEARAAREAALPRWAQNELSDLRATIGRKDETIAELEAQVCQALGKQKTRVRVGHTRTLPGAQEPRYLPEHETVFWDLRTDDQVLVDSHRGEIQVCLRQDDGGYNLQVMSSGDVVQVEPQASNHVRIRLAPRHGHYRRG